MHVLMEESLCDFHPRLTVVIGGSATCTLSKLAHALVLTLVQREG